MASHVLYEKKKKPEETKESIIIAAAKLIKTELREIDKSNKVYSTLEEIRDGRYNEEWVPGNLHLLLSYLVPYKSKQRNIGKFIY